jgi:hypothetical protein
MFALSLLSEKVVLIIVGHASVTTVMHGMFAACIRQLG